MIRILFVCHGNICRSPMAEFVMKDMVRNAGLQDRFLIASAATSDEEIGNPVYPPARAELKKHGLSCEEKTARQVTKDEYAKWDFIIVMEEMNLRNLKRVCGEDECGKVRLLLSFAQSPEGIEDPWYTGRYERVYAQIEEGCRALLGFIRNEYHI